MIGCLETEVRLLCEPEKVVPKVRWMRCTWSISCCIWEPVIFDVGWTEQCDYRRIRGRMICLCIFLWIKSEFCCHSRSGVLRDRCTIEYEWGAVDCMRFCVLVSWRRLLSIEGERTLRSRFRSELGVMVCKSVCYASRVSVDWMAPSHFWYQSMVWLVLSL
jgi:hypothetical protein